MKKVFRTVLSICLFFGFGVHSWAADIAHATAAAASDDKSQIRDMIGESTLLMNDGSMWTLMNDEQFVHIVGKITQITGTDHKGLGVTQDGKLLSWGVGEVPHLVEGQVGVTQAAGAHWLKEDGTVWTNNGKVKNLSDIRLIGNGDKDLAALSDKGELFYEDRYNADSFKKLGTITGAASVTAMAVNDGRVALLYDSGKVIVYETSNLDRNSQIIPVTIVEDAVHIAYMSERITNKLLVTRKDGTVWTTGTERDRWKLTNQVSELSQIVKTAVPTSSNHFFAKRSDGNWLLVEDGEVTPIDGPRMNDIKVSISDLKPFVGDNLNIDILEIYTNDAVMRAEPGKADIVVQKPHLLQLQPDQTLKVLGVGETQVTVTLNGLSKTVTVSSSLRNNLKNSKLVDGVVFLPAKSVFQALGGVVTSSAGGLDVKVGDTTLLFQAKDLKATRNGKSIQLKAAPWIDKGELFIPASLLTDALGAKVTWNGKWKQAEISLGDARMTIVSSETAALVKKAAQGSLAKYIGKTYWVNHLLVTDRFTKVTITDIVPDDTGFFVIVFKSNTGQTLKSFSMPSSQVPEVLADESNFYHEDPYKKYSWSSAVWKQLKDEQVTVGMTKEQVRVSWGAPSSKTTATSNGKVIEVWMYSNYKSVSFVNDKVSLIIQ
ncbi:copper amine oxidase [Paenibacillus selenitireducens]|uniref:Copper amine oxidase n=1 Tax=Paenibacillus selenitireducens TaxID=1324314 RepID=A0A1T2XNV0_9BACL|nr:stalk domain-containing protein [Paenibacillus selenitireducens]OPA81508.1 copper amine oxidase [Paenibacillus selenitireducens]